MFRFIVFFLILPAAAHAYIGPGMVGGVVIALVAFFVAFFICLISIIYFPIKRWRKNKFNKKNK